MQVILEDSGCHALIVTEQCTVGVHIPEAFQGFLLSVDSAGGRLRVLHAFTGDRASEFRSYTEDIHLLQYTRHLRLAITRGMIS